MTPVAHKPVVVVVGPTAVGKTALSLFLAQQLGGEIVSADSRLFYRGLDIGTAKPSQAEQQLVPHHLIDICRPDETISLGQYQKQAYTLLNEIHGRGKLPIVVGGTGQYVWAVVEGWGIPKVPPQPELRQVLEQLGQDELARWLRHLDPAAAEKIDPRNVRRVVRALEVTLVRGVPISVQQAKNPPPYRWLVLGLELEREKLYQQINQRVDQMIAAGLEGEVRQLLAEGYDWSLPAMSGLGYQQFRPYLAGEQSLAEVIERIKFETHRFVRQQKTWFQPHDERIKWLTAGQAETSGRALVMVQEWLNNL